MELDIVQLGASIVSGSRGSGGLVAAAASLFESGAILGSLLVGIEVLGL